MTNLPIEAITIKDGKPVTTSRIVAEIFGKQHFHVTRDIENLDCSQNFRESNFGAAEYTDAQGKIRPAYDMTKDGFTFLVMGYTGSKAAEFKEAYINRFNEMEAKLTNGLQPQQQSIAPELQKELLFAEAASNMLRMSETSKIRMLATVAENHKLPSNLLPDYTTETLTRSATDLLKLHNSGYSVRQFNKLLIADGFLEELTRPSSSGTIKSFKSITEAGLKYGRNETSPENPRETQPRWFVNKFAALLEQL